MSMASKFFALGPLTICGATLIFPVTYIFNDVFTEVYGFAKSRRIIWLGLGAQAFTGLAYWFLGILPPAPFWHEQEAYMTILGIGPRVALASLTAYFLGEFSNSYVISRMKFRQQGAGGLKQSWRFVASTIVGEGVDTLVFFPLAFALVVPLEDLLKTMLTVYVAKVLYEIVALPLSIFIANKIKRADAMDVIDNPAETNYALAKF